MAIHFGRTRSLAPALACAAALCAAPPAAPLAAEAVKLSIMVGFGTGTDSSQIEVHQRLAKEFNASRKDIQIEFVTIPYDEHDAKFTAMLAGGIAPDLVMPVGVMGIATYFDEWLDISPFIKADKYELSDLYGPAVEAHRYGKKTFGLPIGVYPSVVYYNSDLFDKAGVPYPPHKFGEKGWTYDKLVEIAKKLTLDAKGKSAAQPGFDPAKRVQYGFDGWDWSPWRIVPAKFGGEALGMSADYKTARMNTKEWKAAFKFLRDSLYTWHVRPNSGGENSASLFGDNDPIGSNKVAMWECFSWMQYAFEGWNANMSWDVAAVPAGPTGKISAEANADTFAIPKSAKHPKESWEAMKWFMRPEVMRELCASYGCIPARKSLAKDWLEGQEEINPDVDWQVFLDSIAYMDNPNNEAWVPNYNKVWDAMENAMNGVLGGGIADPSKAAEDLNKEVQGYLDEYWKAKR